MKIFSPLMILLAVSATFNVRTAKADADVLTSNGGFGGGIIFTGGAMTADGLGSQQSNIQPVEIAETSDGDGESIIVAYVNTSTGEIVGFSEEALTPAAP